MEKRLEAPRRLQGTLNPPGDKSISHRAAILAALAQGRSTIANFLYGEDCLATLSCLEALGVAVRAGEPLAVEGVGRDGLQESPQVLDCANSGTSMRLLAGLLSGQPFLSVLTGDASLRMRPMQRVVEPLRRMGARIWGRRGGSLAPLAIHGGDLSGIHYRLPVASAQVKSALILAALFARGETVLQEPVPTRDHTERLLTAMGAELAAADGSVQVQPLAGALSPLHLKVPGDISAAAYFLVAAAIHPDADIIVHGVGINPTRTGIVDALRLMGADVAVLNESTQGGEPVADIRVRSSSLKAITIGGEMIPRLIDEVPVLAVAAAVAQGKTVIRDAEELRGKESDRIATTAGELRRLGARVEELPDGLAIEGGHKLRGAPCQSHDDHRLAMALAVAALAAEGETVVANAEAVAVSYPRFWEELDHLSGGA